ncbi:hypothetical protein BDK51DRAFT_42101 [Blyttiomyces helicus]|uniref:Uncharacterized protein n=1 Tax=Blyttiomyces helicus TaxID=388810 RepID=A0A4P9WQK3_9FUNG|nr:hypothetical protein BDK51DRAFT_42101 [Blyttiomyces helicus]|eukprot:RKO93156.1 hypothetical protein BDK51DRAFT_42101 [Blyttiomyces helicus]
MRARSSVPFWTEHELHLRWAILNPINSTHVTEWTDDGTSGVNERGLSTLLNEMTGAQDEERTGVLAVASTNPRDKIDDALLRPCGSPLSISSRRTPRSSRGAPTLSLSFTPEDGGESEEDRIWPAPVRAGWLMLAGVGGEEIERVERVVKGRGRTEGDWWRELCQMKFIIVA